MKHTLQIGQSRIHGRGLFASRPINAGAWLGRCQVVATRRSGPFVLSTEEGDVLVTCRFRYINHSAQPNVAYYDDFSVVALTDIAAGEELTHNYGEWWHDVQQQTG